MPLKAAPRPSSNPTPGLTTAPAQARRIAHLDMDAFYASVELLRRPELRGQPVVIGGRRAAGHHDDTLPRLRDYAGRGVITTATYEARALGVGSGMGLMKAARLAPEAVLLPADFDEYRRVSARFKAAVAALTPVIEDRGIDEIYIDLSDVPGVAQDGGRAIGGALKQAVRTATGLTCSIGIAPNKLLAKLGSDLDKPDGLTLLQPEDLPTRIWPLPAARINGIGPKAALRLAEMGIHTVGELAAAPPALLLERFGTSMGHWLHEAAHGRDERPVVTHRDPKSISRETTFERNLHATRDRAELGRLLDALCERLATDLQRKGLAARTVGVKLRYEDFRIASRHHTGPAPVQSAAALRRAAGQCLKRVDLSRPLRLMGVKAEGLVDEQVLQSAPVIMTASRRQDAPASLPLFE